MGKSIGLRRLTVVATIAALASALAGVVTAAPASACAGDCGESKTLVFTTTPGPYRYGSPINLKAAVFDESDSCANSVGCDSPSGSVDFYDGPGGTLLASLPLHADTEIDSTTDSFVTSAVRAGSPDVVAYYRPSGDTPFDPSEGHLRPSIDVNAAPTNTLLTASAVSFTAGRPVSLFARVTPAVDIDTDHGARLPGAYIEFYDRTTLLGSGPVAGDGWASFTTSFPAGAYEIRARYAGDGDYISSLSDALPFDIDPAEVTVDLTQSAASTVFGQPVTLTATVTRPQGTTLALTGSVTFVDATDAHELAVISPDGTGKASATVTSLAAGEHGLYAVYRDDANFNLRLSTTLEHVVSQADTTTVLAPPTPNPSHPGDLVTLTATVAAVAPGAGTPTGSVQFFDGSNPIGAPVALTGAGATLTSTPLGGGVHSIYAQYLGDPNFKSSRSSAQPLTVLCDHLYSGSQPGNVMVPADGTTCVANATVGGGVVVPSGARVWITGSQIAGGVTSNAGARSLVICGTTVSSVMVSGAAGAVMIGDPYGNGCAANRISSGVTLTSTHGPVTVEGNAIGGHTQVNGTSAGATVIGANTIGGNLMCSGNSPTAADNGRPNTVSGRRTGECASSTF